MLMQREVPLPQSPDCGQRFALTPRTRSIELHHCSIETLPPAWVRKVDSVATELRAHPVPLCRELGDTVRGKLTRGEFRVFSELALDEKNDTLAGFYHPVGDGACRACWGQIHLWRGTLEAGGEGELYRVLVHEAFHARVPQLERATPLERKIDKDKRDVAAEAAEKTCASRGPAAPEMRTGGAGVAVGMPIALRKAASLPTRKAIQ